MHHDTNATQGLIERRANFNISCWVSTVPLFDLGNLVKLVELYLENNEIKEGFDGFEFMEFFLINLTMCFETDLNHGRGSNKKYLNLQKEDLLNILNSLYQECRKNYLANINL